LTVLAALNWLKTLQSIKLTHWLKLIRQTIQNLLGLDLNIFAVMVRMLQNQELFRHLKVLLNAMRFLLGHSIMRLMEV
jgi:hypothetical protein